MRPRTLKIQATISGFKTILVTLKIKKFADIWNKVKEAVRGKVEDITSDPKELVQYGYLRIDRIVSDTLEEIGDGLQDALDRKWKRGKYAKPTGTTTEEAK